MLTPVSEIYEAARLLDLAANAHMNNEALLARKYLAEADNPDLYKWTDALWGKITPEIHRLRKIDTVESTKGLPDKSPERMPDKNVQKAVIQRDGYHCRYCGIPVVRKEVREKLKKLYPEEVRWGRANHSQHAALQCMWLTYDHVLPHSHGGSNDSENVIVSCQPCNCAKMQFLLEEVCLHDPRQFPVIQSDWDGMERVLNKPSP